MQQQQPPQSPRNTTQLYPVGHCTQCGAPIWARPADAIIDASTPASEIQAPPVWRSCQCRPGSLIPRRPGGIQPNKIGGYFSMELQDIPEPLQGLLPLKRAAGASAPLSNGTPMQSSPSTVSSFPPQRMGPNGTAVIQATIPGDSPDWLNDILGDRRRREDANAATEAYPATLREGETIL